MDSKLAAGTRLGPYEIVAWIGDGGMADVYHAHDGRPGLDRDVAIKIPKSELADNPAALARFERETRAVAALSDDHIVKVHDVGTEGGVTYAVHELLHGQTLRERLADGPLPWRKAVEVARGLAQGLTAAHEHGVVHRDLKPENIILTKDDRVKILDFGLARLEPSERRETAPNLATVTEPDTIVGTVGYMSPEQIRGERIDRRSDFFSLGCVLSEMLTGLRAFQAGNPAETMVAVLREEPTDVRAIVPDLPESVSQILRHCLAKNPNRRYQSARDLAHALEDALQPQSQPRPRPRPIIGRLALAAALLAVGVALAAALRSVVLSRGPVDRLAVLPFAYEPSDPGAEYLADGLSEDLINLLSRNLHLTVLARTSAFTQKGKADPVDAGRSLGVPAVLWGRLERRGENLIVTAELVDVRRRAHLWGERFARRAQELQQVEGEIQQEVSRRLGRRSAEPEALATANAEAHDLYLQGRFHWNKRTPDEIVKAIALFERAIALDGRFALAQVGLADAYDLLAFYGALPAREAIPKQRDAAVRALEIDESLAEAHASLAEIRFQYDWDWDGADASFRRAIALNPSSARTHQWYSNYLSAAGRFQESFEEVATARRLDPMDLMIRSDEGQARFFAGDYARAVKLLRQTVDLDPNLPLPRVYLGLTALAAGDLETAIAEAKKAMSLAEGYPDPIVLYGHACGRAGKTAEAQAALKQLEEIAAARYVDGFAVAFLCAGMGEKAKALDALERAFEDKSLRLVYLNVMPAFDSLRSEPRFQSLVARVRIPPRAAPI